MILHHNIITSTCTNYTAQFWFISDPRLIREYSEFIIHEIACDLGIL